jgi:hypothetical protein
VIPHLPGWTTVLSGAGVILHPDGDERAARMQYEERVRPLAAARVVVDRVVARAPRFIEIERRPAEQLVTREGEFAALVTVAGSVDGQPVQRDIGMVFGDDFHSLLSSVVVVPERFAEVTVAARALVVGDSHALGVRRRRYLYTPPRGWQGLPRGLTTEWSPPEFPADRALLHVFPAEPGAGAAELVDQLLGDDEAAGFVREQVLGPSEIRALHGLSGRHWRLVGRSGPRPRAIREVVVLRDTRYVYALRLETTNERRVDEHAATFASVAASVQPLPAPAAPDERGVSQVVNHWTA